MYIQSTQLVYNLYRLKSYTPASITLTDNVQRDRYSAPSSTSGCRLIYTHANLYNLCIRCYISTCHANSYCWKCTFNNMTYRLVCFQVHCEFWSSQICAYKYYKLYIHAIRKLLCRQQHTGQLESHMLFGKGSGVSGRGTWGPSGICREVMLMDWS